MLTGAGSTDAVRLSADVKRRSNARCSPRQRRPTYASRRFRCLCTQREETTRRSDAEKKTASTGLTALWYASEVFGKALAVVRGTKTTESIEVQALSPAERLAALKADYAVNYFISGRGEMRAYAADCLFADDFASFRGTERFRANVSNLGGLLEDVVLDLLSWEERDDRLIVGWRFAGTINALPWRPRLACSGSTTHVYSAVNGMVVEHVEQWAIDPRIVVKQLFTPSKRAKGTR